MTRLKVYHRDNDKDLESGDWPAFQGYSCRSRVPIRWSESCWR